MKLRDQMEAMKNWPLTPDYVINIRTPDEDLVVRRKGEKIDPLTGLLYIKEQYDPTPVSKTVSVLSLRLIICQCSDHVSRRASSRPTTTKKATGTMVTITKRKKK